LSILAFKLIVTPLLIAAASLAQRKWGGVVGGLIAGLPLTSAPVSAFLAVEHGPDFAARAATGTLLGVTAMSAFCVAYAKLSARSPWWTCTIAALAICLAVTLILSFVPQHVPIAALITFPALIFLVLFMGRPPHGARPRLRAPWWDIPARMVVATAVVLAITGAASLLGAKWSGLLSTLPVYALVMGVFSHTHGGAAAAQAFLRGVAIGALGSAGFLLVVAATVQNVSLVATYALASVASVALAALSQASFVALARR
jgi:hypothetical protein